MKQKIIILLIILLTFLTSCNNNDPDIISIDTVDQPNYYISCGCGCCGFDDPIEDIATVVCIDELNGESMNQIIEQDKNLDPDLCALAGCSFPQKYVYCD
jgi:hypothetical protein